jgi:hypothetical protein
VTPIADMVERMFEADSSAEIILLAIRTAENVRGMSADKSADARRKRDRDRKRELRQIIAAQSITTSAKANDVAGIIVEASADTSADIAEKRCDLSSLPSLLKGTSEKGSKGTENARARGTRLLLGSPLSDADRATAIDLGAQPDRVDGMWAEFVDYWIGVPGQRGTKLNWSATWRNRVREVISRGNRNGRQNNGQADRSTSAAAGRVLERIRQLNEPISNRS